MPIIPLPDGSEDTIVLDAGDTGLVAEGDIFGGFVETALPADLLTGFVSDVSLEVRGGLGPLEFSTDGTQRFEIGFLGPAADLGTSQNNSILIAETGFAFVDRLGVNGVGSLFRNDGNIDAEDIAVSGADSAFVNAGDIILSFDDDEISPFVGQGFSIEIKGDGASFDNSGTIDGGWNSVLLEGADISGTNTGSIDAWTTAVTLMSDNGTFQNDGVLNGRFFAIVLDGAGSSFVNTGSTGTIVDSVVGPTGMVAIAGGTGASVTNSGTIQSLWGVRSAGSLYPERPPAENVTVTNMADGTISGAAAGVLMLHDNAQVTNAGAIMQTGGREDIDQAAVYFEGDGSVLENSGTLNGFYGVSVLADGADVQNGAEGEVVGTRTGISIVGDDAEIENAGVVRASSMLPDGAFAVGMFVNGVGGVIENAGTVRSSMAGIWTQGADATVSNAATGEIYANTWAVYLESNDTSFVNAGRVISSNVGVFAIGDNVSVVNSEGGQITATEPPISFGGTGISLAGQGSRAENAGTIVGSVGVMVSGDDSTVENSGQILTDSIGIVVVSDPDMPAGSPALPVTGFSGLNTGLIQTSTTTSAVGGNMAGGRFTNEGILTGGFEGINFAGSGNLVTNGESGAIDGVQSGVFMEGSQNTLVNSGEIDAAMDGVYVTGDRAVVSNLGLGQISASSSGVSITGDLANVTNNAGISAETGIFVEGDDAEVVNGPDGEILGSLRGILAVGDDADVRNLGVVGTFEPSGTASTDIGISVFGIGGAITNSGTAQGNTGIAVSGTGTEINNTDEGNVRGASFGVLMGDLGDDIRLSNDGSITGFFSGVQAEASNALIINHEGGVISSSDTSDGPTGSAITSFGVGTQVRNSGLLTGNLGVRFGGDDTLLENTGEIRTKFVGVLVSNEGVSGPSLTGFAGSNTGLIETTDGGVAFGGQMFESSFANDGTLRGADIGIDIFGSSNQITNGEGGSIEGREAGVFIDGSRNTLVNGGEIDAAMDGVYVTGDRNVITNTGDIAVETDPLDPDPAGLRLDGAGNVVRNSGTISGSVGVKVENGGARIENSGTITGAGLGVTFQPPAASAGGQLINTGSILATSDVGTAVLMANLSRGWFVNDGVISGGAGAVSLGGDNLRFINRGDLETTGSDSPVALSIFGEAHTVINSGTISAGVEMIGRAGSETGSLMRNAGAVEGDVTFGDTADSYIGILGTVAGKIDGGGGDDLMLGGVEAEVMSGGTGNDDLRGRDGDDTLAGGQGDDQLRGQGGNDMLSGERGDDTLLGGGGNDVIDGGQGTNTLSGGGGNDTLISRRGTDTMTGGRGEDSFVFRTNTVEAEVTDFTQGEDLIDLTALDVASIDAVFDALTQTTEGAELDLTDLGGEGTVLLAGIDGTALGSDDFLI